VFPLELHVPDEYFIGKTGSYRACIVRTLIIQHHNLIRPAVDTFKAILDSTLLIFRDNNNA
jgi:hypothetical protein